MSVDVLVFVVEVAKETDGRCSDIYRMEIMENGEDGGGSGSNGGGVVIPCPGRGR